MDTPIPLDFLGHLGLGQLSGPGTGEAAESEIRASSTNAMRRIEAKRKVNYWREEQF